MTTTVMTMIAGKRGAAVSVFRKENADAVMSHEFFPKKQERVFSDLSVLIPPPHIYIGI
jgi:hypothetical protein